MSDQGEQGPLLESDGEEGEWASWWKGYWSDAPEQQDARDSGGLSQVWRESAHEFDFSGEEV